MDPCPHGFEATFCPLCRASRSTPPGVPRRERWGVLALALGCGLSGLALRGWWG
jgi:hypothetical protein